MNPKRQKRFDRHITVKGEPFGRCIRQEYKEVQVGEIELAVGKIGKLMQGVTRYLHVTKGWRTRWAQGRKIVT